MEGGLKFVEDIPDTLICICCLEILEFPESLPCKHRFCKPCLVRWQKKNLNCPLCRKKFKLNEFSIDFAALRELEELEVFCLNKYCKWRGPLRDLDAHTETCKWGEGKLPCWAEAQIMSYEENGSSPSFFTLLYDKFGIELEEIFNSKKVSEETPVLWIKKPIKRKSEVQPAPPRQYKRHN